MELQPVNYSRSQLSTAAAASDDDCQGWSTLNSAGTAALFLIPYVGPILGGLAVAYRDNIVSGLCGKGWGTASNEQLATTYDAANKAYTLYTEKQATQDVNLQTAEA